MAVSSRRIRDGFPVVKAAFKFMNDDIKELLRLTRENNEMLKEIVSHIRRVNTDEFQTASDFRAFLVNICADLLVDSTQRNVNNNNLIKR